MDYEDQFTQSVKTVVLCLLRVKESFLKSENDPDPALGNKHISNREPALQTGGI